MTLAELLSALRRARMQGAKLDAEVKLVTARANLPNDIVNGVDLAWSAVEDVEWDPKAKVVQIHEGGPLEYA